MPSSDPFAFEHHAAVLGYIGLAGLEVRIVATGTPADLTWIGPWLTDNLTLSAEAVPVPEPASLLLLGTGLVGLVRLRKRRG